MDCRKNERNLQVGITQTVIYSQCLYSYYYTNKITVPISDFGFPYLILDIGQKVIFVFAHHPV